MPSIGRKTFVKAFTKLLTWWSQKNIVSLYRAFLMQVLFYECLKNALKLIMRLLGRSIGTDSKLPVMSWCHCCHCSLEASWTKWWGASSATGKPSDFLSNLVILEQMLGLTIQNNTKLWGSEEKRLASQLATHFPHVPWLLPVKNAFVSPAGLTSEWLCWSCRDLAIFVDELRDNDYKTYRLSIGPEGKKCMVYCRTRDGLQTPCCHWRHWKE